MFYIFMFQLSFINYILWLPNILKETRNSSFSLFPIFSFLLFLLFLFFFSGYIPQPVDLTLILMSVLQLHVLEALLHLLLHFHQSYLHQLQTLPLVVFLDLLRVNNHVSFIFKQISVTFIVGYSCSNIKSMSYAFSPEVCFRYCFTEF